MALAWVASWRVPEEVSVIEVSFALPEPAAATPAPPEPAPQPAAASPAPPAPVAPTEASAPPVPADPASLLLPAEPPPRPAAKPARPAPVAAAEPPQPAAPSIVDLLSALPPAPPAPAAPPPVAPAPVAPPALPAISPLQAYALQLRNLLAAHRAYPQAARLRRQEGVVSIALTIDRAGQLAGVRLYEASAFPVLDEAALAMARRAAPFPPPPLEPHQRQAVFVVPVGFALQD